MFGMVCACGEKHWCRKLYSEGGVDLAEAGDGFSPGSLAVGKISQPSNELQAAYREALDRCADEVGAVFFGLTA